MRYARLLGAGDNAEDLTQQAFVEFLRKPDRFDSEDPYPALRKIVRDRWKDRCRKLGREASRTAELGECGPRMSIDPEQHALDAEATRRINVIFAGLSPINRRIAGCRVFLGLPWRRIAALVGLSESAVQGRWYRTIRDYLKRCVRDGSLALLMLAGAAVAWVKSVGNPTLAKVAVASKVGTTMATVAAGMLTVNTLLAEPDQPKTVPLSPPEHGIARTVTAAAQAPARPTDRDSSPRPAPGYRDRTHTRSGASDSPTSPPTTPAPVRQSLELDPDPSDSGRKEADSLEVDTPAGVLTFGGDIHTTGPIGQPPGVAGPHPATGHPTDSGG